MAINTPRKRKPKRKSDGPRRAVLYARCSTKEQAESGLGVEAQQARCRAYCDAFGHTVANAVDENGVSGSLDPTERPVLGPILNDLDKGRFDLLVVARLDRLGRCTADVLGVADRALRNGWDIALLDISIDTSTPTGRLVLTTLAAIAEFERAMIASRTSEALQAKKARGERLGRPVKLPAKTRRRVLALRKAGLSMAATAAALTKEGVQTVRGGRWHASTISRVEETIQLDAEAKQAALAAAVH